MRKQNLTKSVFFNFRLECGEACKSRKLQLDAECKQLRRELTAADDMKKNIEQQNRNLDQEVCIIFELSVIIIIIKYIYY